MRRITKPKYIVFLAVDLALVAGGLFYLLGGDQQTATSAAPTTPESRQIPASAAREQFLSVYRHAHETGDVNAALHLVCRDNVSADTRDSLRESLADDFQKPLTAVEIVPLDPDDKLELRYVACATCRT